MGVIPNPLPIRAVPEQPGTDRSRIDRLWNAVTAIVGIVRDAVGGRLFEWHIDEQIDDAMTPILHGLKRKPIGLFLFRSSHAAFPITNYEAWTESTICPSTSAGTAVISFVLF